MTENNIKVVTPIEDRLVQHSMNIPVGHLHRLQTLSIEHGISIQDIIRNGIELVIAKYDKRKKRTAKGSG